MTSGLPIIDTAAASAAGASIKPGASSNAWSDWVGIVASIGCAIHCAAMPFVIAYLPSLGLSFLADEAFHKWMAVACFVVALTAFIPGLRQHGRAGLPVLQAEDTTLGLRLALPGIGNYSTTVYMQPNCT